MVADNLARFNALVEMDVDMATVRARRAVDVIVRSICTANDIKAGTKPLENLLGELRCSGLIQDIVERHCRVVKDFGNLAAHGPDGGFGTADESFTEAEAQICARSVSLVAEWFLGSVVPRLGEESFFVIVQGGDVTPEMIREAVAIDEKVYEPEFRGVPSTCLQWHDRNPDIYTMIVSRGSGRVVGYINAMPLEDDLYASLEAGERVDVDIPASEIRLYEFPDLYKLYVASIAVDPEVRGSAAFKLVYDAYLTKLLSLARREMFVSEVLADAITEHGERLARCVGMKYLRASAHQTSVYKCTLLPPTLRPTTRAGHHLMSFYRRRYEELRELIPSSGSGPD